MPKVKELMKTQVFTVSENEKVDRVFFLFHYEKIRHVPVMHRRKVIGIVSDRDLYKALGPRSRRRGVEVKDGTELYVAPKRVRHIMRRGVITVGPESDIAEAASLMARRKIGALPVTKGGKLVGIITSTDLLRAFARMAKDLNKLMGNV